MQAKEQELTDLAWRHVITGYYGRDEVLRSVTEREGDGVDASWAGGLVDRLWHQRLREQWYWPAVTDYDRLDAALATLADHGVLVRENWQDCTRCGFSALLREPGASSARGFVFFHQQDTADAAAGGPLPLAYGIFGQPGTHSASEVLQFGDRVVSALRAQGLRVRWSRITDDRILVDLNWRKRIGP